MAAFNQNRSSLSTLDSLIMQSIPVIRASKKRPDESSIFNYLRKEPRKVIIEKTDIDNRVNMLLAKNKVINKPFNGKNSYFIKPMEEIIKSTEIENETINDIPNSSSNISQIESFIDHTFMNLKKKSATIQSDHETPEKEPLQFFPSEEVKTSDEIFLKEEIVFLRKELESKQQIIFSLLNLLKNVNLYQPLVEKKNHPNDENSSINIDEFITNNTELISSSPSASSSRDNINDENKNTNVAVLNNQLKDVRKKQHKIFLEQSSCSIRSPSVHTIDLSNEAHLWSKDTVLIVGDSILQGVDEHRISRRGRKVKVRSFLGASVDDMFDHMKPLMRKCPRKIILHIGTNNSMNENSRTILHKILSLKRFIESELPDAKVIISSIINRSDEGKAKLTVINLNEHLASLELNVIDNTNIDSSCLTSRGLHLNETGSGRLAVNFI